MYFKLRVRHLVKCIKRSYCFCVLDKAIDFRHWGIPLSRRFRALKLWFVIRTYGVDGLQTYIREHCRLAKLFEACVNADDRFEVKGQVTLGLVCFRLKAGNAATQVLLRAINLSGKLHMVPAVINDDYVIRFAVCSVSACDDDIVYAWNVVSETTSSVVSQSASFDLYRPDQLVSESEDEAEAADKVVELARSPQLLKSPLSLAQNGDVDDVFLFDNNIPSIATRIPTSAELADTLDLRRRNRLLRLVSDSRVVYSGGLQRSVSVQLDDRRRQHTHISDHLSCTSWANGELAEHVQPQDGGDDAEVAGQSEQIQRQALGGTQSRSSLTNGGSGRARRKKMRSVDACCSGSSDAVTMKRRGMMLAGKIVVVDDDGMSDDDNAEVSSCHLCNGLDDQPKNNTSTPERSNKAN